MVDWRRCSSRSLVDRIYPLCPEASITIAIGCEVQPCSIRRPAGFVVETLRFLASTTVIQSRVESASVLHVVSGAGSRHVSSECTLGFAIKTLAGGTEATLMMNHVRKVSWQQRWYVSPDDLLGYAAAHEIGHLLTGANSHSAYGVIKGHWEIAQFTPSPCVNLCFRMMKQRECAQTSG